MIVLISGWKHSGKDTAASWLIEAGYRRVGFADKLKDMVSSEYGVKREALERQELKELPLLHLPVLSKDKFTKNLHMFLHKEFRTGSGNVPQEIFYDEGGDQMMSRDQDGHVSGLYWTPRAIAILEGSVKRTVNANHWVERALDGVNTQDNIVISDFRYQSEYEAIKRIADEKGIEVVTLRINRFDESPSNDPSERDLDGFKFDYYIENKSTLEVFKASVTRFMVQISLNDNPTLWG